MSNLLPSRQFGYIVLTTSLGIMDQEEVNPLQTTQARLRPMRGRPCAGLLTDDFGVTLSVRRVLVFYVLLHLVWPLHHHAGASEEHWWEDPGFLLLSGSINEI
jgi:hypothetical protein